MLSNFCHQCLSLVSYCRTHCYKIILVVVIFFFFSQYAMNLIVKNKIPKIISPSLSWVSSLSAQKMLGLNVKSETELEASQRTIANVSEAIANNSTNVVVTKYNFTQSAIEESLAQLTTSFNISTTARIKLPLCPLVPPNLVGRLKVLTDAPDLAELEKMFPKLELGGRYRPPKCQARSKVAIIVPYRNREHHLKIFLHNMHQMLQRQQIDYGIYIIEEAGKTKFNRALLMNIGYAEASKDYDYGCFIFHDVDLIPEDDRNLYNCPEQPRHMSVAIDTFNYRLPYKDIFGGVSALSKKHMEKVNGFSNEFWGWGGEDDDMSNRLRFHGLQISRYPANIARYKMLKHSKDEPNPERYNKLYKGRKRFKTDGINSIHYKRLDFVLKKLYTWVLVELKQPDNIVPPKH